MAQHEIILIGNCYTPKSQTVKLLSSLHTDDTLNGDNIYICQSLLTQKIYSHMQLLHWIAVYLIVQTLTSKYGSIFIK